MNIMDKKELMDPTLSSYIKSYKSGDYFTILELLNLIRYDYNNIEKIILKPYPSLRINIILYFPLDDGYLFHLNNVDEVNTIDIRQPYFNKINKTSSTTIISDMISILLYGHVVEDKSPTMENIATYIAINNGECVIIAKAPPDVKFNKIMYENLTSYKFILLKSSDILNYKIYEGEGIVYQRNTKGEYFGYCIISPAGLDEYKKNKKTEDKYDTEYDTIGVVSPLGIITSNNKSYYTDKFSHSDIEILRHIIFKK